MKRTMLLVLIAAGLLAGCGEKTPKCSSDDAKSCRRYCQKDHRERYDAG